ncbi:MAG TPA: nuclear transport factor 2 family protein [Dehalococcoidia bacterium]|nr:nuclear transport factor 2 family protein [Dehalococcoidia bacterium]
MPEPMSAQDRLDVMELIARYAQCIDGGDRDGYAANFVPDAVVEWQNGSVHGRDEIREWVGEMIDSGRVGSTPALVRHFVGLPHSPAIANAAPPARTSSSSHSTKSACACPS